MKTFLREKKKKRERSSLVSCEKKWMGEASQLIIDSIADNERDASWIQKIRSNNKIAWKPEQLK